MTRPIRTIHVALTDGERVLVDDDGRLPTFEEDPDADGPTATATASTLLSDAVHLAPVVVLDDANRLHVLGARDGVSERQRWIRLADLPAQVREPVRTAVRQHWGTPPAGRPEWYRPGWHDEVETWLDSVLAGRDTRRTGSLRVHHVWSISAVHTIATDHGLLWFKASCDHFAAEAGIVATVAAHLPDLVPEVAAVDRDRGWLLTEPLSGTEPGGAPVEAAIALAPLWAAAQLASLDWVDELRAAGAPDRGLGPTLAAWREALATNPELAVLTHEDRSALDAAVPVVEDRLRELWACGFPDTLGHGDLHSGNVAHDGADVRVFDWSDGCVTHPLLDGTHLAHWISQEDGSDADRVRAVLAPWRDAFPDADFDRAVELAPLADLVFQTVTFDRLTHGIEAGTGDFDGVVVMLTRKILGAVADAAG